MQKHSRKEPAPQVGTLPVISLVGSSNAAKFDVGDSAMIWEPGSRFHRATCSVKYGFGLQRVIESGRMVLMEGYTVRYGNQDYFLRAGALARLDGSAVHIALVGGAHGH